MDQGVEMNYKQTKRKPITARLSVEHLEAIRKIEGYVPNYMILKAFSDVSGFSIYRTCEETGMSRKGVPSLFAHMNDEKKEVYEGVVEYFQSLGFSDGCTNESSPKRRHTSRTIIKVRWVNPMFSNSANSMIRENFGDKNLARYQAKQKSLECRQDGRISQARWFERVAQELA